MNVNFVIRDLDGFDQDMQDIALFIYRKAIPNLIQIGNGILDIFAHD